MATSTTMIELRSMNPKDLSREIRNKRAAIGSLRLKVSLGKEKNTSLYRKIKKELAQLLTIWSEKEHGISLNPTENKGTVRTRS